MGTFSGTASGELRTDQYENTPLDSLMQPARPCGGVHLCRGSMVFGLYLLLFTSIVPTSFNFTFLSSLCDRGSLSLEQTLPFLCFFSSCETQPTIYTEIDAR